MEKQVDKSHYEFKRYCYPERWASYYHQLELLLEQHPTSILEVGVGDGVVRNYIRENTNIKYTSVDIDKDLRPDIVGSVTDLPFADNAYDTVCAFEVLEHLPFDLFEKSIDQLRRVSNGRVIISLPHFGPTLQFLLKIPFLSRISFSFKIPWPKKHAFNGQHYWEIGTKGYSPARIQKILEKHFLITKDFVPFDSQYHHFYVLERK